MAAVRARVFGELRAFPAAPAVGGGREELVYRVLAGAWYARHGELLRLTVEQSEAFFGWVAPALPAAALPAGESVLVTAGQLTGEFDDSILGATLTEIESVGLKRLSAKGLANAAHLSMGALMSTYGSMARMLEDQRSHLWELLYAEDVDRWMVTEPVMLSEEVARFFRPQAAAARLGLLTLAGTTRAVVRRALLRSDYEALQHPDERFDVPALAARLLIDAHLVQERVESRVAAIPADLTALLLREASHPSGAAR